MRTAGAPPSAPATKRGSTAVARKLLPRIGLLVSVTVLCAWAGAATWNVSTMNEFDYAMSRLSAGDEVVMAPGTYDLTLKHGYYITIPNVTIRGATGNRDDVTLWGGGINNIAGVYEAIQLVAPNITVSDLTIEGFFHHAIHFQGAGDNAVIRNVKTLNIGAQHMKGSGGDIRNGLVEFCEMTQTIAPLDDFDPGPRPDEYTGGIDLHDANGWIIRDNYIHGIQGEIGDGDAGIFLWNGCNDNLIERNVIADVNKGIAIGNYSSQVINYRNTVRNNLVIQEPPYNDVGIEMFATVDSKLLNNSIIHTTRSPVDPNNGYDPYAQSHRTLQIGWADTNLQVVNNIIRGNVKDLYADGVWSNATVAAMGNIVGWTAQPDWFVDMLGWDLHLTANAAAIDAGSVLADVLEDIQTALRGAAPDMGADEFGLPLVGDANMDGQVGIADLVALAEHYGLYSMLWPQGDFNMDHHVGIADLSALADHYGDRLDGGTVPEPASLLLILGGAAALLRRR